MIWHNLSVDGRYLYRRQASQSRLDTYSERVVSIGLRWNLPYRNWVF